MLSYKTVFLALLLSPSSLALPIRREVPQEHSHQQFLTTVQTSLSTNNPDGIVDSVFGLLGDAAAAAGAGKITDVECLQQATADQAFTNAKAANDVAGMTAALIYRALERNTGSVGAASNPCTSITAVNKEIAAIQQHQDPASPNAAATNKAITLTLAQQIASIGGDPLDALKAGTFAPGTIGDPTGAGNTCDVATDTVGCIFTQNLLVEDATPAEISAAVAGSAVSTAAADDSTTAAAATATAAVDVAAATAASSTSPVTITATESSVGNFGSCTIPEISFGLGFDGRKETSFEPTNQADYNHGSADAIAIITQFMCNNLVNSCGADATAQATCAAAETAANAVGGGKTGAAADTFNGFFGIATNFRDIEAVDDQGNPIAGTTGGSVSVAVTGAAETGAAATAAATAVAAATATAAAATAAVDAAVSTSAAASTGANLQTFTQALGGDSAPPVTAGGEGFETDNSQFVNLAAALGRSCDVQHNLCANTANSGGGFAVSACDTQNTACHALIPS